MTSSGQANLTDLELIGLIKEDRDSAAVTELVHRHTGIYVSVIETYRGCSDFRRHANVPDLKEDKFVNIWQWALKYDPSRPTETGKPMEFGSYVAQNTKYLCKHQISKGTESLPLDEACAPTNDTPIMDTVQRDSVMEVVAEGVAQVEDPLFRRMFELRYGGQRPLSWRAVVKKLDLKMTHEGARKAFNKHMRVIKEMART